jgi:hypothetical protein
MLLPEDPGLLQSGVTGDGAPSTCSRSCRLRLWAYLWTSPAPEAKEDRKYCGPSLCPVHRLPPGWIPVRY